jgi:nitroreductase
VDTFIIEGGNNMDTQELAKLIKSRRSIRVWQDKPVSEDLLMQALDLATWAPNGGNRQNWHFYVITNKKMINSIGNAASAGRNLIASWPETKEFGGFPAPPPPAPGQVPQTPPSPLTSAPIVIAVGTLKAENPMEKLFLARGKSDPKAVQMADWNVTVDSRIQSISAAIAYLLLVLHQMGLGSLWMTGPLPQSKGEIEKILNCPPDMDIIALILVGYAAENPTRTRKPVKEVCTIVK